MKKLFVLFAILFAFNFANAQQMSVGIGANLFLPTGSFGDAVGTGIGGNVKFEYKLQPGINLTGAIGYLTFSAKEADFGWEYSVIPVLVGAKYFFAKGTPVYGTLEAGMNFASVTVKIPTYVIGGVTYGGGEVSESGSNFGYVFGAGYELPLGKAILDISAKYQTFESEVSGINIGVAYKLPI